MKYQALAKVYDLGPFIEKVVLDLEGQRVSGALATDAFEVYVARRDKETGEIVQVRAFAGIGGETYPSEGYRQVVAAYASDKDGNPVDEGDYIALELEVDPRISVGSTIYFNGRSNVRVDVDCRISQLKPIEGRNDTLSGMIFTQLEALKTELSDLFVTGECEHDGIKLTYAAFEPQPNGSKRPLLIWLHGGGEGGTDPIIAVSGNKVVNLASEAIQKHFGGAYVLGPQAPTFWMDDGSGEMAFQGETIYVPALHKLIEAYVDAHEDIDRQRIYLGGCSNGGFMTLKMLFACPQLFAAAYPICEALEDIYISDEEVRSIRDIPMWFVHAQNDPIVDVKRFPDATYKRMIEAGAGQVHYARLKNVPDRTGRYFNEDGTVYEYNGHFSWIPALNDEITLDIDESPVKVDGKAVSLFEWVSKQVKK